MDWVRIRQLFHETAELPPSQREDFLSKQCGGDDVLRAEVMKLLVVHNDEPAFLGQPIARVGDYAPTATTCDAVLKCGETLNGRYTVESEIGSGGFSRVYLATDIQLHGRKIVIKIVRTRCDEQWVRHRFNIELEALARVDHPGVVNVIDHGHTTAGLPYVVMQYIHGKTLRVLLNDEPPPWPLNRTVRLVEQVAGALTTVHKEGICHRDLRPENVIIRNPGCRDEQAVIIDFGIATVTHAAATAATTRVAGSPEYMAPEQLLARPTPASDVYSLGAITFELLSGVKLHCCDNIPGGPQQVVKTILINLPEHVRCAVGRAVNCDEAARYQDALEFAHALTPLADTRVWRPPQFLRQQSDQQRDIVDDKGRPSSSDIGQTTNADSLTQAFQLKGRASSPEPAIPEDVGRSKCSDSDSLTAAFKVKGVPRLAGGEQNPVVSTGIADVVTKESHPEITPPLGANTPRTVNPDSLTDMFKSPLTQSDSPTKESSRPLFSSEPPPRSTYSNAPGSVGMASDVPGILSNDEALFGNPSIQAGDRNRTDILHTPANPSRGDSAAGEYTKIFQVPHVSKKDLPSPAKTGPSSPVPPEPLNRKFVIAIILLNIIALIAIAAVVLLKHSR